MQYSSLVNRSDQRLSQEKFRVWRQIDLQDSTHVDLFASRTDFSWKAFVFLSQYILLEQKDDATVSDFQTLFDQGYRYARKLSPWWMMRGMQFGFIVIPCIAAEHLDPQVVQYVTATPRKHWSLFEFPVACELSTGKFHYHRETAIWGALYYSNMRRLVERYIEGQT